MSIALHSLPENIDELRAFAAILQAETVALEGRCDVLSKERKALETELYAKTLHIEKLKAQLALLKRARYGRSSEKLDHQIEQLELTIGELEETDARSAAQTESYQPQSLMSAAPTRRERFIPVHRALPEHLPRERVEHPAACSCPACGSTKLTRIGTDEREVLEYVPSQFKVIVHARPKMSCRACETITQAPLPSLPIERGHPGPGLLAHVLVSKYADHLPLYRQSGIYARVGVAIERSTMADWVEQMAFLLQPLADAVGAHVRAGETLYADDTPVPVLDPGRGQTKTGRLWVAIRDERSWGSGVPPAAYYQYAPDRKAERAQALLRGCQGYLHADAYAGFRCLYEPNAITGQAQFLEVGCWAHARRKIYEVHAATSSPRAQELLEQIGSLFAIEAEIKGQLPDARYAARQLRSVPTLAALRSNFDMTLDQISGKSSLAQAIRYATSRWTAMTRYMTDGRLDISNNAAERAMRPIAIGRNNWTFAGSDSGGERGAMMYTLIESAKLNGADPEAYLRNVIGRIADHPARRITELLPWNISL